MSDEIFRIVREPVTLEFVRSGQSFHVCSETNRNNSGRLHRITPAQARALHKWLGEQIKELEQ